MTWEYKGSVKVSPDAVDGDTGKSLYAEVFHDPEEVLTVRLKSNGPVNLNFGVEDFAEFIQDVWHEVKAAQEIGS